MHALRQSQQHTALYAEFLKPFCDRLAAGLLLIMLSPLLLALAVIIRFALGSPVLFRQSRPGLDGNIFRMFKFRTMRDARGEDGSLLPDAERLTRLGCLLRATSLDELPELINVVKGDMSLVGPRPLLVEYLERYSEEQARRHTVRPGITGWAQVNGRNAICWEEKFALDVWYADHLSPMLDLRILWLTAIKVLRRDGITQPGEATAQPFQGNLPFVKEPECVYTSSAREDTESLSRS